MVTEYGMSARLGAVRYGREQGDPFLGRSMGNQADYSLEVAHEIDEEVRALIEAAHTEAWEILNTYRDVLDDLVFELLQKETLTRVDLERIFDQVEKRPRITAFNDFGQRTPSDKPPIKTPAERARERGEPWPPDTEPVREPTPVGSYPGGGNGVTPPGPNGTPSPTPPGAYPGGPQGPGFPAASDLGRGGYAGPGGAHRSDQPRGEHPRAGLPNSGPGPHPPNAVLPNYGAPPDWRPATTPTGQSWPPPGQREQGHREPGQWDPGHGAQPGQWVDPATAHRPGSAWTPPGNGRPPAVDGADGADTPPSGSSRATDDGGTR
jgi:cell division protease FtsH